MKLTRLALPLVLLVLAAPALFAACGDGPDEAAASAPTATPTKKAGPPVTNWDNATVTATGLKYIDQKVGEGATPTMNQSVTVHYTGWLAADGKKFDSSVDRGTPATFPMNGVVPGFSEAISTMKVGGKRTAYLPSALGYGSRGAPGAIPPNADIIFEIELISVR